MSMECIEKEYAAFEKAMDEERVYRRLSDFSGICALIGVDPIMLDKVIYGELGYSGQGLVDFYRSCEDIH